MAGPVQATAWAMGGPAATAGRGAFRRRQAALASHRQAGPKESAREAQCEEKPNIHEPDRADAWMPSSCMMMCVAEDWKHFL